LGRRAFLFWIRAVHSLIFLALQTMICYLLYTGFRQRTDGKTAVVTAVVGSECLIYAGSGFRCPLTQVAEKLGAERGSVTDIFLPRWLAANVAKIYGPMFAIALYLHARNLRQARATDGVLWRRVGRCYASEASTRRTKWLTKN